MKPLEQRLFVSHCIASLNYVLAVQFLECGLPNGIGLTGILVQVLMMAASPLLAPYLAVALLMSPTLDRLDIVHWAVALAVYLVSAVVAFKKIKR